MRILTTLALTLALTAAAVAAPKKPIHPKEFPTGRPFSPGILTDGTLYIAGQTGQDVKTGKYPDNFEAEVKQCLENIALVLKEAQMGFFFFLAEDGIRDPLVTGVQTCALPISCSPTFTAWCQPGFTPNSSTSSMCESQVTGCQLDPVNVVHAQRKPSGVTPARTCGFVYTYRPSSRLTKPNPPTSP